MAEKGQVILAESRISTDVTTVLVNIFDISDRRSIRALSSRPNKIVLVIHLSRDLIDVFRECNISKAPQGKQSIDTFR